MSYLPNLTYYLDRLSGFSTNIFRIEAQNNDSAAANKILRFTLPSNALLNLRSFALHFMPQHLALVLAYQPRLTP